MTTQQHGHVLRNQVKRLATRPHSLEAVEHYCRAVEELLPKMPEAVAAYLAAVRAWAIERRNQMILANTGLVYRAVDDAYHWLTAAGIAKEDAVNEVILTLAHAADLYDLRRGHRFTTYATYWIRQAIQRLRQNSGLIRVPPQSDGKLRDESEQVRRAERIERTKHITRITTSTYDEDDDNAGTQVADRRRDHREITDTKIDLEDLLRWLDKRERLVMELRYLRGWRLEEIGEELGKCGMGRVSKERVRQLIIRAMRKMRERAPVSMGHLSIA